MKDKVQTKKSRMYEGTNRKARTLAVERRKKQLERYYTYASISFISALGGFWLGIMITKLG